MSIVFLCLVYSVPSVETRRKFKVWPLVTVLVVVPTQPSSFISCRSQINTIPAHHKTPRRHRKASECHMKNAHRQVHNGLLAKPGQPMTGHTRCTVHGP
ncbi:hypothetical protein LZ30DRAFT_164415 [Colletotrichum cereale]|nr:hypothetical protein LZ30DRAFT_164415 [Colletotrichum cereale]